MAVGKQIARNSLTHSIPNLNVTRLSSVPSSMLAAHPPALCREQHDGAASKQAHSCRAGERQEGLAANSLLLDQLLGQ